MNSKYFISLWAAVFVAILSLTSCDQTENPVNQNSPQTSYQDLYNQLQSALENSKSIEDLQQRKAVLYTEMKAWDWNISTSTRTASDLPFEKQKEFLQNTLSPQMLQWINRLQDSFVSNVNSISIEQIANDNTLKVTEKQMLVAILAGGDYLKKMIQTTQTRAASDCYAKYQRDCERALQTYAVSGTVGSLAGGLLGLAGATAVCALQLSWAEDDYNDCLAGK